MTRVLLFVAALLVASTAGAQTTTTSTSTSTSTSTLAAGASWVCTIAHKWVAPDHYETSGACVGTGAYTNGGGDALGSAATMSATARALCGDGTSVLVNLVTTPAPTSTNAPNAVCGFNFSTFKYVCSVATTAANTSPLAEANFTSAPITPFKFRAICR